MFYLVCSLIDGTSVIQATLYGIILFCRVFLKEYMWLQERNGHLQRIAFHQILAYHV